MLAGQAIEREEVAVAVGVQHHLARLAVEIAVHQNRRLGRIPVVRVVRIDLVVPRHLAGVDVDRDDRAGVQIVARAARRIGVGRRRIAGAEDIEMRFRIVGAGDPHVAGAVLRAVEAAPGIEARVAGLHRHGVEDPLHVAGFGIARLQVAGLIEIVAGADEDVVADDDGRHGGEVLLIEVGDFLMPALLAGARVEADQIVVRRFHVQPVAPHAQAAVADVRAALGFPEVVPQFVAVASIDRPGVVRGGEVENAVDFEDRAANIGGCGRLRPCRGLRRRRWWEHAAEAAASTAAAGPPVTRLTQASVRFFTFD